MNSRPIGIFDSGVGGLTVFKVLESALPDEAFVYLGDTARVPYGTRSAETVVRYSLEAARFLADHDVKMLIVACNSASSVALDALAAEVSFPVIGVIEPGARRAAELSPRGRIGVIGTRGTIASEAYAVFRGEKTFEIGVITARAHRGRGLAVAACRRLIEECRASGMDVYWSCHESNLASQRAAVKLGFEGRRPYRFYVY